MTSLSFDIAHLLAGGLVLVSFMMLYQDRLSALINVYALHALVLTLSVAWQAQVQHAPHLYVTAAIALGSAERSIQHLSECHALIEYAAILAKVPPDANTAPSGAPPVMVAVRPVPLLLAPQAIDVAELGRAQGRQAQQRLLQAAQRQLRHSHRDPIPPLLN